MAWTTPSIRSTGDLITASIWNTDIKDNLRYLKGMDGQVTIEDDILPNTNNTKDVGSDSLLYQAGYYNRLYAGNGLLVLHRGSVRQVTVTWESDDPADQQLSIVNTGGGDRNPGGTGQWVFSVRENAADTIYVANQAEQNNAFDTSFNASRYPYLCVPFELDGNDSWLDVWIGYRQTLGSAVPNAAAEKYAGIHFDGTTWYAECADGTSETQEALDALAAGQWHVVEIAILASSVVFVVDGVIVSTLEANLPTGDLDWQVLMISDASGGGATTTYLTVEEMLFQESLS